MGSEGHSLLLLGGKHRFQATHSTSQVTMQQAEELQEKALKAVVLWVRAIKIQRQRVATLRQNSTQGSCQEACEGLEESSARPACPWATGQ